MFGYTKVIHAEPRPGFVYEVRRPTIWPFWRRLGGMVLRVDYPKGMPWGMKLVDA